MGHRKLLANAEIISLDAADEVLHGTDVGIDGATIDWIGDAPKGWSADERVDLTGHALLPGFWNAHTHAAMVLTRSLADDLSLDRWFNERIWIAESGLTADDVYWGGLLAAAEMIRSGTVGFADHYFQMHRMAEVVEEAGLKALLAETIFSEPPAFGHDLASSLESALRLHGMAGGRIHAALGPHSAYLCAPELLREVAEAARDSNLRVHIHVAESSAQVEASLSRYGMTPVQQLADLGAFDGPTIAAHCIAVTDDDLSILAAHDVTAVQCPRCHMKLGLGVTPVVAMHARGIRVALGTDGAGSNNNLDMLEEARLAALIHKHSAGDAEVLAGDAPLRLAGPHGAAALGFGDSGVIRAGASADLIALDLRRSHIQPVFSLVGSVLHAANSADVVHTLVDGRWLMRDRELVTLDEERILAEAPARAIAMVDRGRSRMQMYPA
jgi:5-methylthioadenosine/S-adenosylhomocysteine deaminase